VFSTRCSVPGPPCPPVWQPLLSNRGYELRSAVSFLIIRDWIVRRQVFSKRMGKKMKLLGNTAVILVGQVI
jgi:hypothetical protein